MLYAIFYPLRDEFFVFNVFRYITFRSVMASITAFLISVLIGPILIKQLKRLNFSNPIQRDGFSAISDKSKHKSEVPTMGGLLIIGSIVLSSLLWADLSNRLIWIALGSLVWMGFIGFMDDFLKMAYKDAKGLQAATKLTGQIILGITVGFLVVGPADYGRLYLPFFKDFFVTLGPFYILFVCLVLTGSSNAVNLTDGLDGLAIGCTIFITLTYAVFSYLSGHAVFCDYLHLPYIVGAGELTVFCASLVGASMGFLWFNSHPASVFMGDTGSLSIGGALGIVAVLIKKELLLLIVGGVFVIEAVSVILQVASFRFRGKRIFLMAPLHHHFQLKGWPESKIVVRFWIISVILALAGLASLKLR